MYYRERLRSFLFLHVRACQFFCAISFASFAHLQEVSLDASMGTFTQKLVFEMFVWPLKSVPMCFNAFLYTVFSSAGGVAKASTKGKGDVIFSAFFISKSTHNSFDTNPSMGYFIFHTFFSRFNFVKLCCDCPAQRFWWLLPSLMWTLSTDEFFVIVTMTVTRLLFSRSSSSSLGFSGFCFCFHCVGSTVLFSSCSFFLY